MDLSTDQVPFGFGLSYDTHFTYSNFKLNATSIGHCESISASVSVTNSGSRDGDEVVQLYVETPHATVKAPRLRLADFARVHIPSGKTVSVDLTVTPKYHSVVKDEGNSSFWNPNIFVESGAISLHVGGGQPGVTKGVLEVTATVKDSGALTTEYKC
jgi:beta-glucosidase